MSVEILWEPSGVYRRFFEVVEPADLLVAVSTVHADERFEQCSYTINDFLDVSAVNVQLSNVMKTSLQTIQGSKRNANLRMAFIANRPDVREFVEFFSSPSFNPYPTVIVETASQAREWVSGSISQC